MITPSEYKSVSDNIADVYSNQINMESLLNSCKGSVSYVADFINNAQLNPSEYYNKYYVLSNSVSNVITLTNTITNLDNIDSAKIIYGGITLPNIVTALQTHVNTYYITRVNAFLSDNNIKVKRSFANLSNSLGFPINESNILEIPEGFVKLVYDNSSLPEITVVGGTLYETEGQIWADPLITSLDVIVNGSISSQLGTLDITAMPNLTSLSISGTSSSYMAYILNGNTALNSFFMDIDSYVNPFGLDLSGCVSLISLDVSGTHISSLDVSGCISLSLLNVAGTSLTALDVSGLIDLTNLDISGCTTISSLSPSGLANLTSLDISGCVALSSLDISGCTNLNNLTISGSYLIVMNASNCTSLPSLDLAGDGNLSSLNISGCSDMISLNVTACTSLATLDISGCTSLSSLSVSATGLASLDVSGFTSLSSLDISYSTYLTSLIVTGCINLLSINAEGASLADTDSIYNELGDILSGEPSFVGGTCNTSLGNNAPVTSVSDTSRSSLTSTIPPWILTYN